MTEVAPPDVILLRSADEPDPYVEALGEAGLRGVCRPVLGFEFPADEALRRRLQDRARYEGVVATSPRAAFALWRIFDPDGTLHTTWEAAPAYVVGPKTAEQFRDLSFDVRGSGTGSAEALVALLREERPSGRLLFLSGNRRRDTLPDGLRAADIPFDEEMVYETQPRTDLTLPPADGQTWLVFFSPSGLEALECSEVGGLQDYHIAAIGPTTAAELQEAGLPVDAVADVPSPESLAAAIADHTPSAPGSDGA
jgi:uroporphyrinogen-III synthase